MHQLGLTRLENLQTNAHDILLQATGAHGAKAPAAGRHRQPRADLSVSRPRGSNNAGNGGGLPVVV